MSKFHTTVSRRDFMKGLGLTGAGLGATAAAAPVFHDLDEAMSAPEAGWKRPWYVKQRDYLNPVMEMDWSQVTRRTRTGMVKPDAPFGRSDPEAIARKENLIKKYYPDWTGDSLKSLSLSSAVSGVRPTQYGWDETPNKSSPEDREMARYTGTPEENLRMIRAAFRLLGVSDVGVTEIDANTMRLINSQDGNRIYSFRNVDWPIETDTERIIPQKCKYMITWTHAQATELSLRSPATIGQTASSLAYSRMPQIVVMLHNFLHGIGYIGINGYSSSLAPSNPFGVLSGVGEHARMAFVVVSPEFGATHRGMNRLLTNLPLETTNPIDAGIYTFCETCKICAEEGCPYDALPLGEATWEGDPAYQPMGFKGWRLLTHKCLFCRSCQSFCPFNSTKHSFIHDVVGATLSYTSLFNGFFANMEKTFGYGMKDPEGWWELEGEPTYGVAVPFISKGGGK